MKLTMATDGSLLIWFVVFIAVTLLTILGLSSAIEINKFIAGSLALVIWPLTFPFIVKATKYKKREYNLPKSRLAGYLLYLVVPVTAIALALSAAIYFEVGM